MNWTMVIALMSNLGISTCADNTDSIFNPIEWGTVILDWLQSIIG